jgi:uncharacterized repeat protein (TIGR03803 family)
MNRTRLNQIRWAKIACLIALFCLAEVVAAQAQTFEIIANLPETEVVQVQLIPALDGNLLGLTESGGKHGRGEVFEMDLTGQSKALYNFCSQTHCTDGSEPEGMFQAPNGTIYGTTDRGGAGSGTIFALAPDGKESVLYSFCTTSKCSENILGPTPSLNGGLLGGTVLLGSGGVAKGGTLWELTAAGEFKTLYDFCKGKDCADGSWPSSPPFQTADGSIYGATGSGGTNNAGYFYKLTTSGQLEILYSFPAVNLGGPDAFKLIQGADGNLYGLTAFGGPSQDGSVFEIDSEGQFSTLYNFCSLAGCADGAAPEDLLQGSDGNLYGVTYGGGSNGNCGGDSRAPIPLGCGTVFELTPKGVLTTLHSFCSEDDQGNCVDGAGPIRLVQDPNGTFYGLTATGGENGGGIVFSLSTGLKPFVSLNPIWSKVGKTIDIVGTSLTGTTSVSFHGVAAEFKLESDTLIHATVPSGATTGKIEVTTPGGTLNSNLPFQVLP